MHHGVALFFQLQRLFPGFGTWSFLLLLQLLLFFFLLLFLLLLLLRRRRRGVSLFVLMGLLQRLRGLGRVKLRKDSKLERRALRLEMRDDLIV